MSNTSTFIDQQERLEFASKIKESSLDEFESFLEGIIEGAGEEEDTVAREWLKGTSTRSPQADGS